MNDNFPTSRTRPVLFPSLTPRGKKKKTHSTHLKYVVPTALAEDRFVLALLHRGCAVTKVRRRRHAAPNPEPKNTNWSALRVGGRWRKQNKTASAWGHRNFRNFRPTHARGGRGGAFACVCVCVYVWLCLCTVQTGNFMPRWGGIYGFKVMQVVLCPVLAVWRGRKKKRANHSDRDREREIEKPRV